MPRARYPAVWSSAACVVARRFIARIREPLKTVRSFMPPWNLSLRNMRHGLSGDQGTAEALQRMAALNAPPQERDFLFGHVPANMRSKTMEHMLRSGAAQNSCGEIPEPLKARGVQRHCVKN
jgi:hypothetical protein